MILGLDHIAVAVDDLDAALGRFVHDLGLAFDGTEDVPSAQTKTAFLPVSGTRIELVTPLDGQGPIRKHLDTRGPGLHHLCFRVTDVVAAMEQLSAKGYRFTTDAPTPGAHGTKVVFLHPKSMGGVLVELAEHPSDGHHP